MSNHLLNTKLTERDVIDYIQQRNNQYRIFLEVTNISIIKATVNLGVIWFSAFQTAMLFTMQSFHHKIILQKKETVKCVQHTRKVHNRICLGGNWNARLTKQLWWVNYYKYAERTEKMSEE